MVGTNDTGDENRAGQSGPGSSESSPGSSGSTLALVGALAVLVAIAAGGAVGANGGPTQAAFGDVGDAAGGLGGDIAVQATTTAGGSPVARCTLSDTSIQVGDSVNLDASESENVDSYQYSRDGSDNFGDFSTQESMTFTYREAGTYEPHVRVWGGPTNEESDVVRCGTLTVSRETPTPTPSPTPTATPEPTPTATATAVPGPTARCRTPDIQVTTGERVLLDATDSTGAESYVFSKFAEGSFVNETGGATIRVRYQEPGTYRPAIRVTDAQGRTDTATCGEVTVTPEETTPTPTSTVTPTGTPTSVPTTAVTPTATPTPVPTATPTPTVTATAVPTDDPDTTDQTETAGDGDGNGNGTAETTTAGRLWFEYAPEEPSADESVDLSAEPAASPEDVAAYRWHLDGDETPDRTGRTVTLPASNDGETTRVTLVVERTDGTTEEVSRDVPVDPALSQGTATDTPGGADAASGLMGTVDSISPVVIGVLVLLLLLVVALLVLYAARRRLQTLAGE